MVLTMDCDLFVRMLSTMWPHWKHWMAKHIAWPWGSLVYHHNIDQPSNHEHNYKMCGYSFWTWIGFAGAWLWIEYHNKVLTPMSQPIRHFKVSINNGEHHDLQCLVCNPRANLLDGLENLPPYMPICGNLLHWWSISGYLRSSYRETILLQA